MVIFLFFHKILVLFLVFVSEDFAGMHCVSESSGFVLLTGTIDFCLFVYLLREKNEAVSFKVLAALEEFYFEKQPDCVAVCD